MTLTRVLLLPAMPKAARSLAVVMHGTAAHNVRVSVEAGFDSTLPAPLLFRPSPCRACWKNRRGARNMSGLHHANTTALIFRRLALRSSTSSSVAMLVAPACMAHARCSASPARSELAASRTNVAAR